MEKYPTLRMFHFMFLRNISLEEENETMPAEARCDLLPSILHAQGYLSWALGLKGARP